MSIRDPIPQCTNLYSPLLSNLQFCHCCSLLGGNQSRITITKRPKEASIRLYNTIILPSEESPHQGRRAQHKANKQALCVEKRPQTTKLKKRWFRFGVQHPFLLLFWLLWPLLLVLVDSWMDGRLTLISSGRIPRRRRRLSINAATRRRASTLFRQFLFARFINIPETWLWIRFLFIDGRVRWSNKWPQLLLPGE